MDQNQALPRALLQKCILVVKARKSNRSLARMIASRRNAIGAMMLPEATTVLLAANSAFKVRIVLFVVFAVILLSALFVTKWLFALAALIFVIERVVARNEREFWSATAAVLLAADMLISDFAGWGSAFPAAREVARRAFPLEDDGTCTEWIDYFLPQPVDPAVMAVLSPQAASSGQ